MSSELEAREALAVGPDDITITEAGKVEIVNRQLAEALKALRAEEAGGRAARADSNFCGNKCGLEVNGNKCGKKD